MRCSHCLIIYEQYFLVGLFVYVIQCGSNVFVCGSCSVTVLWEATEQYFHMVLFVL